MRLAGKVAVVTGGGSGIGRATALLFAREGARVAVLDRDGAAAEAVVAEMAGEGMARAGDVAAEGVAAADAAAVLARWGRIDALVTAAGFSSGGTAITIAPADFDAVVRVHLWGTWLWMRAVLPAMQAQGGSIVAVSSQLARAGGRNNVAYIAAKAAVLGLVRTTALDYASDGVRVNAVLPGAIETPMLARSFARSATPAATAEQSRLRHPMGRFGRAEEVAEAVLYLASDASGFTTGVELPVDGGWLAG